jgi:hypothetical protein
VTLQGLVSTWETWRGVLSVERTRRRRTRLVRTA